jgi:6-pyruvoyl-tetrahydropterin synthase
VNHRTAPRTIGLIRAVGFSAAHRYFNSSSSAEQNQEIYGSLYREKGFGHNFRLEAEFVGPIDPLTGMIVNLILVDTWLGEVVAILDHKHLNELEIFKGLAPTPERIAAFCFAEIRNRLRQGGDVSLQRVRLYEGDTLWVDVYSER